MTGKIFRSTLAVALAVLVAAIGILLSITYDHFCRAQRSQLRDELTLAAAGTELGGRDYLHRVESTRFRLTWVGADGAVLFDTQADAAAMENHGSREEIREALDSGRGSGSRRSDTLMEKTLYEAVRLRDGTVLRLSANASTAGTLLLEMLHPVCVLLSIALILCAVLAHRMARRIVEPLNRLDLEHPLQNEAYPELEPMLRRLSQQHLQIAGQLKKLKWKTDEFQRLTESMGEGLVLLDSSGLILSINPAAAALYGASAFSLGRDFITLDQTPQMRSAVDEAFARGAARFLSQREGRTYQFSLDRILSDGAVIGLVILSFDVTGQVQAQQSRREFSANVSHELKTPLQSILGSAELMEQGLVRQEDIPRFAGLVRREANRLLALVQDIIGLSQLDEETPMALEAVALEPLVRETAAALEDKARQRQVALMLELQPCTIQAAPRLVSQILYNLTDNAIEYNRPGGTVTISCRREGDAVALQVADTGIGIPPEHQSRIFERFYRVDRSRSRQQGGTGLGLSIVKHAAERCGAAVKLESQPGAGTRVTVTFCN